MADTFVARLTGQTRAGEVSVEVGLVMTDAALLAGDDTPARLHADGLPGAVVPASLARSLLRGGDGTASGAGSDRTAGDMTERARVWLRRLYTSPSDGTLVAMDSRRRLFDGQLRRFLVRRDQYCRTPWCGAPIRHADHVRPDAAGGDTSADNGQGLCAACNYTKEIPGWTTTGAGPPGPHAVRVTTPTGHSYDSTAPPVLDSHDTYPHPARTSRLEEEYALHLGLAA
jgi:hypothetical protein